MAKLTKPQIDILRAARDGRLWSGHYSPIYMTYQTDSGAEKSRNVQRVVDKLNQDTPLIEKGDYKSPWTYWRLTDAGRAALDAAIV